MDKFQQYFASRVFYKFSHLAEKDKIRVDSQLLLRKLSSSTAGVPCNEGAEQVGRNRAFLKRSMGHISLLRNTFLDRDHEGIQEVDI